MLLIRPTTQNIAELLYVHHAIAPLTTMYPRKLSSGKTTPRRDVKTNGRRQYPSTELERPRVSVEERFVLP
jgi:hypothetical protein